MAKRLPSRARRGPALALLGLALLAPGCALPVEPSMATVPRAWRKTNPWSPDAYAARADGRLKPLFCPPHAAEWAAFARQHIEEGDLLFRYGLSTRLLGKLQTRVLTRSTASRFSHDAIAHWEGEQLFIYDAQPEPEGIRKMPFEFWVMEVADGSLVIRRLLPPYRPFIPGAIAYCEEVWQRQVPFDPGLRLDDERLYCTEMIEKGFRCAGLALSEPVPIRCEPNYRRYRFLRPLVERFTDIRVDEPAFAPGNCYFGTFSSPYLETVYDAGGRHRDPAPKPPTCPPVPFRDPPEVAPRAETVEHAG
jgi:hypothetical protein